MPLMVPPERSIREPAVRAILFASVGEEEEEQVELRERRAEGVLFYLGEVARPYLFLSLAQYSNEWNSGTLTTAMSSYNILALHSTRLSCQYPFIFKARKYRIRLFRNGETLLHFFAIVVFAIRKNYFECAQNYSNYFPTICTDTDCKRRGKDVQTRSRRS